MNEVGHVHWTGARYGVREGGEHVPRAVRFPAQRRGHARSGGDGVRGYRWHKTLASVRGKFERCRVFLDSQNQEGTKQNRF